MDNRNGRASWRGQLTLRGSIVGVLGCIIITASSAYTALKLGALPWPIVFAAVVSLFFLKLMGNASLNEANVTHTIMSAGAMVAGGLAFTIPGAWMLGLADEFGWQQIFLVALCGTVLGLLSTALIHRHFIVDAKLEFPTGTAAAETLRATEAGGKTGTQLFASMGIAGLYSLLRDGLGIIPTMLCTLPIPGVAFGIYNSPMMLSIGFLVGTGAMLFWIGGAVCANFGLIVGGSAAGLWDVATAQGIVASLGMGLMMGSGVATVLKDILPQVAGIVRGLRSSSSEQGEDARSLMSGSVRTDAGILGVGVAACALLACFGLGLSPVASVVVVALSFVTTIMSAQSCGQTGIDPMEIFGLIVLLAIAALGESSQVKLFFVAGVVAVACGLAGDVMNDFRAGHLLGTDPRAQWLGQALGGLVGAAVAAAVMVALVSAYGPDAFGPGKDFVAAQSSVVATMISGIPSIPWFVGGLVAGIALYWAKIPSMMIGLGVYLPFYMSFSSFLGVIVKLVFDKVAAAHRSSMTEEQKAAAAERDNEAGLVVASGTLGGESIVGVIIAFVAVFASLAG
ncbi:MULTISPECIES: OPT/YSL family transporter [Atopobiaceae]|uniref:Oligopeptide transporter, OPT family n=1 Tax=Parafannyhessea umbonata TaxID=604330 RepID=A0A1H6IPB5_9ACTN|nr:MULTISPECIES: OPT/YSL family transporter [Atopobiaceae]SEH50950.1 putative oligopeptide transporter, OPT family [Parafannyhessea umbonata]SJZ75906.1 putative oligopeptide transporter, OPT family [Olsenella sp. KH1P3]